MKKCNYERYASPGFLLSGYRQDGERWTCPKCKTIWEHVCTEDNGCQWERMEGT